MTGAAGFIGAALVQRLLARGDVVHGYDNSNAPYRVCNLGNNRPVQLPRFIGLLEQNFGRTTEKRPLPMQPGDVPDTWADVSAPRRDVGYAPNTSIDDGVVARFVEWYRGYYN
ncbi:NAD-dependent epimerase/dehydratase family protein [Rhodanobacter soli]|uniref:NAD-dependent epimerase/dehydratase family protein n=1 Tax=Rhodanobacter soli TaxID=590609 RepID=UPI003CD0C097